MKISSQTVFAIIATIFAALIVAFGLLQVGSPQHARMHNLDEKRLTALQGIATAVDNYIRTNRVPPRSLSEVALWQNAIYQTPAGDPETKSPYGYQVTGPLSYELCASFATASDEQTAPHWRHKAGRQCFNSTVSLPPIEAPVPSAAPHSLFTDPSTPALQNPAHSPILRG